MGEVRNVVADTGFSPFEQRLLARQILLTESKAIQQLAECVEQSFCDAVSMLEACRGNVIVSGMGKAGLIGKKIAATFASTGTPSHFVHPAEAVHGDLGCIRSDDVVLVLSHSGNTEEVTRILSSLRCQSSGLIAITGNASSVLAKTADVVLLLPPMHEACVHGLAPSTSTTSMLALGDALAIVVSKLRGFGPSDFARFHPGGALGRKLSKVDEVMRPLEQCRICRSDQTIREVLVAAAKPGRRTGAIMLTDAESRLKGIFTDSDLARLLEKRQDQQLDQPIETVMTRKFHAICLGASVGDAIFVLSSRKISELPVVDERDRPVGILDITDLLSMLGSDQPEPVGMSSRPLTLRLFGAEC